MLNFCTLFDSNFFARGLVMYESLVKQCKNFHLYIFAFDNSCYEILNSLNLNSATIISLNEFEDQQLLNIKSLRSKVEYFWTCTPSIILYCIDKFPLDHCTYIDADLCFYKDPSVLYNELGNNNDVLITEHHHYKKNNLSDLFGKFNVQFVSFKNNENGIKVLNWWRDKCIEWCYDRVEENRFGDQKYLDTWTEKFKGVHILENIGGGVATWNVNQYKLTDKTDLVFKEKKTGKEFKLIFFHFHALKFYINDVVMLSDDKIDDEIKETLYFPYINELIKINKEIILKGYNINSLGKLNDNRNMLSTKDMIYIFRKENLKLLFNFKFRGFIKANKLLLKKYRNKNYYLFNNIGIKL